MKSEISRQCKVVDLTDVACGPVYAVSIEAEIVINDNGDIKYCHCSWVNDVPDMLSFEVNRASIFEILTSADVDNIDELEAIRANAYSQNRLEYAEEYDELKAMIIDALKTDFYSDEDDDELKEMIEQWDRIEPETMEDLVDEIRNLRAENAALKKEIEFLKASVKALSE